MAGPFYISTGDIRQSYTTVNIASTFVGVPAPAFGSPDYNKGFKSAVDQLAQEALGRLERRLTRLVRRAHAGRIETVLGRKQALELEVEALSQGYLPPGAVDSLEAARYLGDDEEYWPFDGEDWDDEYIGGEGLR